MKNIHEVSLLLDYYGNMLTKKQYDVMDMHYNNDYSFGEIAEYFNISRQGVYDSIKKGKKILYDLECKLGILKKVESDKKIIENLISIANSMDSQKFENEMKTGFIKIKEGLLKLLNKEI